MLGKATSHVTLITSRSVFRCLMQLASALLSLVATVAGRIHLKEAGYSSPVEEHVLVASSSCRLIRFAVMAVGR